jgi:hypothetical protein
MWGFGAQEPAASVSITRVNGAVSLDYWEDSASAKLLIIYGHHRIERLSSSSASWSFPVTFPIDRGGAVVVLFTDSSGEVTTGWGTALSPGPFAAG